MNNRYLNACIGWGISLRLLGLALNLAAQETQVIEIKSGSLPSVEEAKADDVGEQSERASVDAVISLLQETITEQVAVGERLKRELRELQSQAGELGSATLLVRQQLIGNVLGTLFDAKIEERVNKQLIEHLLKEIHSTDSESTELGLEHTRVERRVLEIERETAVHHLEQLKNAPAGSIPKSRSVELEGQINKLGLRLLQTKIEERVVANEASAALKIELAERRRNGVAISIKREMAQKQLATLSASMLTARRAAALEHQIERHEQIVDRLRDRLLEVELQRKSQRR